MALPDLTVEMFAHLVVPQRLAYFQPNLRRRVRLLLASRHFLRDLRQTLLGGRE